MNTQPYPKGWNRCTVIIMNTLTACVIPIISCLLTIPPRNIMNFWILKKSLCILFRLKKYFQQIQKATWRIAGTRLSSPLSWPAAPELQLSPSSVPSLGHGGSVGLLPAHRGSPYQKNSCPLRSDSLNTQTHTQFTATTVKNTQLLKIRGQVCLTVPGRNALMALKWLSCEDWN